MAGMTITEKIMARSSGRDEVRPGELLQQAQVASLMTMDFLGNITFKLFDALGAEQVWDSEAVIAVSDHLVPPPSEQYATLLRDWRQAVRSHGIKHFYDLGRQGIGHQIMVEKGHARPGTICAGTDSHANTYGAVGAVGLAVSTTDAAVIMATGKCWFRVPESVRFHISGELPDRVMSKDLSLHIMSMMQWNGHLVYKAVEYTGPAIRKMSVASRMALCNMTVDLGAKNGIVAADEVTIEYLKGRCQRPYETLDSDPDAEYDQEYEIDASRLSPQVARPHSVDNACPIEEVDGIPINKAFVGTCTNGRLEDIAIVAQIMAGKEVHPDVQMIVVPASQEIYLEAIEAGYVSALVKAGVAIDTPSCAACAGLHTGVLAPGDICISAGNRNFKGRMGSAQADIYLASPATVAASALQGRISDPRRI